jgi:SAM-dependent methyltransferase
MDAKEMDFPDASFDHVIAGFIGWDDFFDFESNKFVADDVLTKQIVRVLKPNGRFGLSTWLRQEDLDWMKQFLDSHGIECRRNYHPEHEEGCRIIMRESGLNDLWFLKEDYQYIFPTKEFWWKEMTDYNWIEGRDAYEVLTESIKRDAFEDITDRETDSGGIRFIRTALFMTANKI